ncbi:hypothetical protein [Streptomyces tagetis]|uniref:Uncharacterized protein n=1 Tax=Streptomyces tagetis TaxID=2820809 RepID=A0A940XHZ5_9ACTN|nr:hypothetical protein [Streptomyces sp. RG38]MBQ0827522.1 hypothetical protein [Streptomyces sp. RG38]
MVEPVVVVVALAGARLVYALVALWTRPAWERAWAHAVATVVRASGPGGVVEVTRADGDKLTARRATQPPPATKPGATTKTRTTVAPRTTRTTPTTRTTQTSGTDRR